MSVETRFTREILIGALCHGVELPSIGTALKVPHADVFAFSAGTRCFSSRQASALARLSGVSINELALRGVRATANPSKVQKDIQLFDEMAAMFAERRSSGTRQSASARRRQPA